MRRIRRIKDIPAATKITRNQYQAARINFANAILHNRCPNKVDEIVITLYNYKKGGVK